MKRLEVIGVMAASRNCAAIIRALGSYGITATENSGMTPTELARAVGIARSTVSDCLDRLKKADVVECVNPNARKGRRYRLTVAGKRASDLERVRTIPVGVINAQSDEVDQMFTILKSGIAGLQDGANELGAQLRFYEMKFSGKNG